MRGIFAAVLALSLALTLTAGVGSTSRAQEYAGPDGSFGGSYIQPYPGYLYGPHGNRWAAYFGYPPPDAAYMVVPATPEGTPVYEPQVRVQGRNRAPAPYRRGLPRGQAILPNGLPPSGYQPMLRGQTYGRSYGVGPYGTNYYSGAFRGMYVIP